MRLKYALTTAVFTSLFLGCFGCLGCGGGVRLQGAGATFPEPLYNKWFKNFSENHTGIQVTYEGIGSGNGKKRIIDDNVDFGASDAAMTSEEMSKVAKGVVLLPMTAGAIALIYNVEGVTDLKLPREVYADIFRNKIKNWNDPRIRAANPEFKDKMPDQPISVVVRADKSGTSFVFTKHLSAISKEFDKEVGAKEKPSWPKALEGTGNGGVTDLVQKTPGAIGYVEYSYAKGKPMAILENKAGKFVPCDLETSQAALKSVELPANLIAWLPDPEGEKSYPIVSYTWMIFYNKYHDEKKFNAIKDLIHYCVHEGQKSSAENGYIPLPEVVVARIEAAAKHIELTK